MKSFLTLIKRVWFSSPTDVGSHIINIIKPISLSFSRTLRLKKRFILSIPYTYRRIGQMRIGQIYPDTSGILHNLRPMYSHSNIQYSKGEKVRKEKRWPLTLQPHSHPLPFHYFLCFLTSTCTFPIFSFQNFFLLDP